MQVLAVVVRYKTSLSDSLTIQGYCHALQSDQDLAEGYSLLVWDNSPDALTHVKLPVSFAYQHSSQNLGVSGAYNRSLAFAEEQGHNWILLLDQDSTVTADFLRTMLRHAKQLEPRTDIAAITPTVKTGQITVSPKQQLYLRSKAYPESESGIASGEALAINSGCIMRVASLRQVGNFSEDFWLDYSDLYVFRQFYLHGLKVWRAADAALQHEMSIMDYDRLMTPWRYRNFSAAETAFNDLYQGKVENTIFTLKLFLRAIKQRFKYQNPEFSRIAWAQFLYRVRVRRRQRMAQWIEAGRKRRALTPISAPAAEKVFSQ